MSKLVWDESGKRYYETGVSKGVLYPASDTTPGQYDTGVAWNGLTGVTETPTGGEASPLYADNIKYLNLVSTEELEATVEAYTYPDEFAECDGSAEIAPGVRIGQQKRKPFALCYQTKIGNDHDPDLGFKLHILYGALASPSEKAYETVNDDPDAINFSWDVTTTPVEIPGFKPTALLTIDSTKVPPEKMNQILDKLYGGTDSEATLLMPAEIVTLIGPISG